MQHRHTSPFEMVELKFHVKLPIFVARQWIRHRTGSFNEASGRYRQLEKCYYVPQGRGQSLVNKQASSGLVEMVGLAELSELAWDTYKENLDRGVARELARLCLTLNYYTEWFWKTDLHNLFHFLKLRLGEDSQPEIREYALAICELIRDRVPIAYNAWRGINLTV